MMKVVLYILGSVLVGAALGVGAAYLLVVWLWWVLVT